MRSSIFRVGLGVVLVGVVGVFAASRYDARQPYDLLQVYVSGQRLLHEQPIYGGPYFPYPPFATVFFAPLALGPLHTAVAVFSLAQILVAILAGLAAGRAIGRGHPVLWGLASCVVILKSDVFINSLFLHNPSMLFALPAAAVLALLAARRDRSAAVVTGVSVAVKPLLALLLLVPLLGRRPRAFCVGVAAAAVLTAVGLALSHDLAGAARIPAEILRGTNLRGGARIYNDSLSSVGAVHHRLHAVALLARIIGVAGVVAAVAAAVRGGDSRARRPAFQLMLVMALPVLGSLSEIHYGIVALPALIVVLACAGPLVPRVIAAAALLVLTAPVIYAHITFDDGQSQLRWCLGQTLALAAGIAGSLTRHPAATAPTPEPAAEPATAGVPGG